MADSQKELLIVLRSVFEEAGYKDLAKATGEAAASVAAGKTAEAAADTTAAEAATLHAAAEEGLTESFGHQKRELRELVMMSEHLTGVHSGLGSVIRMAMNPAMIAMGAAALAVGHALEAHKKAQEEVAKAIESSEKWVEAYAQALENSKDKLKTFDDFQRQIIETAHELGQIKLAEEIERQGKAVDDADKKYLSLINQLREVNSEHKNGTMSADSYGKVVEGLNEKLHKAAEVLEAAKLRQEELNRAHKAGFQTVEEYERSLAHWNDIATKAYDITHKVSPATRELWQEQSKLADEFNRGAMSAEEFRKRFADLQTIYDNALKHEHEFQAGMSAAKKKEEEEKKAREQMLDSVMRNEERRARERKELLTQEERSRKELAEAARTFDSEIEKADNKRLENERKIERAEEAMAKAAEAAHRKESEAKRATAQAGLDVAKGAFGENKSIQVAQAIMDGISSIQRTLGAYPYPWNAVLAAADGLLAAENVTKIEGIGFDDPANDAIMRAASRKWASDMARETIQGHAQGWQEGLSDMRMQSMRGGGTTINNNISNPGATHHTRNFYVSAAVLDTGRDQTLRDLAVKLREMDSLTNEGKVR